MPCSTVYNLTSSIRPSAYFTVQITCLALCVCVCVCVCITNKYILLRSSNLCITNFKLSEQNLHRKEILQIFSVRDCENFIPNECLKHFNMTYISVRVKIIDSMLQFIVEGNTNFITLHYTMLRLL